jgi:hypothetical protein
MAQHEELDVLGAGRADHQQDQSEHVLEDQVQQPQRHVGIMPNSRLPLVSDPAPSLEPHKGRRRLARDVGQLAGFVTRSWSAPAAPAGGDLQR